ncbi:MAG TPA: glucose-6-phosphate isomerase [Clostridiales bacterium]|nr:glucose-6-phosphate isomerase [Clostridiales bacterium]
MSSMLKLDTRYTQPFIKEHEPDQMAGMTALAHDQLHGRTGPGSDFLGWLDLPAGYDRAEYVRVNQAAQKIRDDSDALVVIGIGGSYLGARAAVEMLCHGHHNTRAPKSGLPRIYFAGCSISPDALADLLDILEDKDLSLNVISKSGTTTEPAIAFRIFKQLMEKKYGKEGARSRIYATTDKARGSMRQLAEAEGYETFVIPDDVGGRYSVLTPVGLLPMAACGLDVDAVMQGAADGMGLFGKRDLANNPAYRYAAIRSILCRKGYTTEVLANFEPGLHYFTEWWKQLYGESEGKDGKGIFPAGADFTTDLHSMGQYIQDGRRNLFETVLWSEKSRRELLIPSGDEGDGFGFLTGKGMSYVNTKAMQGTVMAHHSGGVPVLGLSVPELSPYWFGQMVYFFEKACGISGYLQGVNPFDQPGVEEYKKNMFALLGKPGFEKRQTQNMEIFN